MKFQVIVSAFVFAAVIFVGACTSVKKDELVPKGCKTDSADYQVSYNNDIVPIFEVYCYNCHGSSSNETSGGIILEDTTVLNKYIESGQLVGNITGAPGYNQMPKPPAPPLTSCEISQITRWVEQGAPKDK
jgi:hypothetical protein